MVVSDSVPDFDFGSDSDFGFAPDSGSDSASFPLHPPSHPPPPPPTRLHPLPEHVMPFFVSFPGQSGNDLLLDLLLFRLDVMLARRRMTFRILDISLLDVACRCCSRIRGCARRLCCQLRKLGWACSLHRPCSHLIPLLSVIYYHSTKGRPTVKTTLEHR